MGSTKIKTIEETIETPSESTENETVLAEVQTETATAAQSESRPAKAKMAKPKKGHKERSKAYLAKAELVEKTKRYPLNHAIELAKSTSYSKKPGSLEIHILTNTKGLRGLVNMPHLSGKNLRILAFGPGAAEAGADIAGDDAKLDDVLKGRIDFDVVVTHPSWMPKLARAAKILGPKGMMPNPKNGTVTDDLAKAIAELKGGKFEYKTENNLPVMHLRIGDLTQPDEELAANIRTLATAIGKTRLKAMTLAASMGVGVKVDTSSI